MRRLTKSLAFIAAILCGMNGVVFTYCGFVALSQGNMESVAKSVTLVGILTIAEILCILELTRE